MYAEILCPSLCVLMQLAFSYVQHLTLFTFCSLFCWINMIRFQYTAAEQIKRPLCINNSGFLNAVLFMVLLAEGFTDQQIASGSKFQQYMGIR